MTFREFLAEQLKDPEFKKEYDALEPEFEEIKKKLRAEGSAIPKAEKSAVEVQPTL